MYDVHRHMGGCFSTEFIWGVVLDQKLTDRFGEYEDVVRAMTFENETEEQHRQQSNRFLRFLDKFRILDSIAWTEELVEHSIADICAGLQDEGIEYAWLDFSINKYTSIGWTHRQAIEFIHGCFEKYRPGKVGLVLSLKYESDKDQQYEFAKLVKDDHIAERLLGIDLVGDESKFDPHFYVPLFNWWNCAGKITRAHVGESESHENIRSAIELMNVTNVAHGIKIVNDYNLICLAGDRRVTFDLALTSNILTGVFTGDVHPGVHMRNVGLMVTLGSDDPTQCSTTLANEHIVAEKLGFTQQMIKDTQTIAMTNTRNALLGRWRV